MQNFTYADDSISPIIKTRVPLECECLCVCCVTFCRMYVPTRVRSEGLSIKPR